MQILLRFAYDGDLAESAGSPGYLMSSNFLSNVPSGIWEFRSQRFHGIAYSCITADLHRMEFLYDKDTEEP